MVTTVATSDPYFAIMYNILSYYERGKGLELFSNHILIIYLPYSLSSYLSLGYHTLMFLLPPNYELCEDGHSPALYRV